MSAYPRANLYEEVVDSFSGEWGDESGASYTKILRTTNFTNEGVLDFSNVIERSIEERIVSRKKLQMNDIIIEKSGGSPAQPVGRVVFFDLASDESFICNNFTAVLRFSNRICPRYVFHVLFLKYHQGFSIKYQNKTTGIRNLKLNDYLKSIEIPLPPLEEQKRIAAILDAADAIRAKRKAAIGKLDELAQSVFLEMFGDPVRNEKGFPLRRISEVADIRIGPFGSFLHKRDYVTNGIPLINPIHMIERKVVIDNDYSISLEKMQELISYRVFTNDVIVARRGEIGRCALVTESENGFLCGTGSMYIRPNGLIINSVYLLNVLSSNGIKRILNDKAKGITMKNLNSKELGGTLIPVPGLEMQVLFATSLAEAERLKSRHQSALAREEALFASLQHRAFAGEL